MSEKITDQGKNSCSGFLRQIEKENSSDMTSSNYFWRCSAPFLTSITPFSSHQKWLIIFLFQVYPFNSVMLFESE